LGTHTIETRALCLKGKDETLPNFWDYIVRQPDVHLILHARKALSLMLPCLRRHHLLALRLLAYGHCPRHVLILRSDLPHKVLQHFRVVIMIGRSDLPFLSAESGLYHTLIQRENRNLY
jgi:hypothetical protein